MEGLIPKEENEHKDSGYERLPGQLGSPHQTHRSDPDAGRHPEDPELALDLKGINFADRHEVASWSIEG